MGKKWKMFLFFGSLVVLAGLSSFFLFGKHEELKTANSSEPGQVAGIVSDPENDYVVRLAKYLSDSSMILYGSSQTAETKEQKELFGEAFSDIDYVDCDPASNDSNSDECMGQNITVYPTWVYKGEKFEEVRSLSELAKITGFEQ